MSQIDTPALPDPDPPPASDAARPREPAKEIGGPKERDPTRYGDWTVKGRCIDF